MALYVCVAAYAISPVGQWTVAPGDEVELDPKIAAPYLANGDLVAAPGPMPAPTAPASKSKETPQ